MRIVSFSSILKKCLIDFIFICLKFTVCHVKTKRGWERAQQSKKKEKEDFLLTKTYKLTSFFQVVEKEAGRGVDDLHSNFSISYQSDTVQDKIFNHDNGDDIKSSLTSDIQSSHPI